MDVIWGFVARHLNLIGAAGIPVTFLCFDAAWRWLLGQTNFDALGSDAAQAGCTLFAVTIFRQIRAGVLTDSSEILTALVWAVVCGGAWFVSLMLSFKKLPRARAHQVLASRLVGLVALALCTLFTLHIET